MTETGLDLAPATDVAGLPASATPEPDAALVAAVDLAREAARSVGGDTVGEHLGTRSEGELVVTHAFTSTLPGYRGWHWAVSVTRGPDDGEPTVDEVVQLPGDAALLAPAWVPWEERVRPGDLSPGDLLPPTENDVRLVPAYTDSGDPTVEAVAFELGIGRERVLSRDGRLLAAERWFEGDRGPDTPMARQAPASCGTCGFLVSLAGSLSGGFGVCANEVTDTDGQVVSVEYGCGAHSQVVVDTPSPVDVLEVVYDDGDEITPNEITPNEITPDEVTPDEVTPDAVTPVVGEDESDRAAHAPVPGHDREAEQTQ